MNKTTKKIVLFQPHSFSPTRLCYFAPLALLGISRFLAKDGYTIKIVTPVTHRNHIESVVAEAKDAICLGISAITGYSIYDGLRAARAVRSVNPSLPIIWGGWHPSILPQETVQDDNVDIVVKGQGERTFYELVKAIENKETLSSIPGVVFKGENRQIIENVDRPLESLDNFPPIPYHLVDIEKFIVPQEYGQRSLSYYTSYGCPYRCIFCVEQVVNKRAWVGLSPEKAAEEIADMKSKYQIDSVQIIDSNFFINEDRAYRFARSLLDKKVNIKWGNVNGRTRQLSQYGENTWQLMKESGLSCILIGAESGDNETLKYMQKDITVEDTLKLTEICGKYNIKILSSFLVGFPRVNDAKKSYHTVEKEIRDAFSLIDKMLKIFPRIRMMFALYLPYPSTALFKLSRETGLEVPKKLEDWHKYLIAAEDATQLKVRQTWITKNQARKILMASIYIFFFLDPDSFNLVTAKITNRLFKYLLFIGFSLFKSIARVRWKYKYFEYPIDFYLYNLLRKYSKLG